MNASRTKELEQPAGDKVRLGELQKEVQKGLADLDAGLTTDGEEVFTKLRAKNAARRRKA